MKNSKPIRKALDRQVAFRLPADLVEQLDSFAGECSVRMAQGIEYSRSDIVRISVMLVLEDGAKDLVARLKRRHARRQP